MGKGSKTAQSPSLPCPVTSPSHHHRETLKARYGEEHIISKVEVKDMQLSISKVS